jgi:hypothetical protein
MIPFEEDNLTAYRLVLRIEIALRECIRISLEANSGTNWRRLIPGDLLKKIRNAQREENQPQFDYLHLGPLYYLTLGELIPILNQKVGRSVAERFGGDSFIKQLENILGPRNALCHSRRIPSVGLGAIKSLYHQMETSLTPEGLREIVSHPDSGLPPENATDLLIDWLMVAKQTIQQLNHPVPVSESYEIATQQYWWDNSELSGFNCLLIEKVANFERNRSNCCRPETTAGQARHERAEGQITR